MTTEINPELIKTVVLLGAAVLAVPIFRRLGLGSVLGYLAAGLLVGPFGLSFFEHPETILHLAELGVVMFLFIIGLEMQPSRLWTMRRQIFGLGLTQVLLAGAALTLWGVISFQLNWVPAFIAGMGFVLTSTAIAMQLLEERGDVATPAGQRIVSILLLEDLAIVPLLAIVAFLAPSTGDAGGSRWMTVGVALASIVGLVAVSRWVLNPMFRLLARHGAREVMTAAALLVVLGSALLMQWGGLSMAMGAFAAGVMLSESSFRHQLEADVEPFRGLLLGLFFMGVGMSLNLPLVWANWPALLSGVVALMLLKGACIYTVARLTRAPHREALERAGLMAQGGEFAFVLYSAAAAAGLVSADFNATLTAAIILSMALTPVAMMLIKRLLARAPGDDVDLTGVDEARDLSGSVLVIGFGRFAQLVCQPLLARGLSISIIERDTDMIRAAARFGFKVYYGDGSRLDVLHASGAEHARLILVCTDGAENTTHIVELIKSSFPLVPVFARAYDRQHAVTLTKHDVDYQLRETLESALVFSHAAMQRLGIEAAEADEVIEHVRRKDLERLEAQIVGDVSPETMRGMMQSNRWTPTPLTAPQREGSVVGDPTPP